MGTSNFDSNIKGKDGDETIKAFGAIQAAAITATAFTGPVTGDLTGNITSGGGVAAAAGYIKLGTGTSAMGLFFGPLETQTAIEAYASSLIASPGGSLYLSNYATPALWYFTDDTTATNLFQFGNES